MSLDITLYRKLYLSYDKGVTYIEKEEQVYDTNITHNLGEMAEKAGIYKAVWRPYQLKKKYFIPDGEHTKEYEFEENNIVLAGELIHILESGLIALKLKPDYYKTFDSPNGWGLYKHFVPFVEKYLDACREYPDAIVRCCR